MIINNKKLPMRMAFQTVAIQIEGGLVILRSFAVSPSAKPMADGKRTKPISTRPSMWVASLLSAAPAKTPANRQVIPILDQIASTNDQMSSFLRRGDIAERGAEAQ